MTPPRDAHARTARRDARRSDRRGAHTGRAETFAARRGRLRTRLTAALEDAAYRARREILSMHPGVPVSGAQLAESRLHNEWALRRGVTLRSIHLVSMLHVPHGRAHLRALAESGVDVRVAEFLPFRAVVLDGVLAYTSLREHAGQHGALELYGPPVTAPSPSPSEAADHDDDWRSPSDTRGGRSSVQRDVRIPPAQAAAKAHHWR